MRSPPFYLPLDNAPTEKGCKGSRVCINHILPSPQTHLTKIQRQCHLGPKLLILKLPYRFGARHPDLHPRLFWDYVSPPGECSAGTDTHHQCWQGAEQSQMPSLAWVPPRNTLQAWSTPTALRIADKGGVRASPKVQPSWLASGLQDVFPLLHALGLARRWAMWWAEPGCQTHREPYSSCMQWASPMPEEMLGHVQARERWGTFFHS